MGSEPRPPQRHRLPRASARPALMLLAAVASLAGSGPGLAQQTAVQAAGIYTCTDDRGRRLTADRPIAECAGKPQQILNKDGSLRGVLPPTLTAEERAAHEARERAAQEARAAQQDAARRDRNLVARYPDEARHRAARESALDTVRLALKAIDLRQQQLLAERKPLRDEAEFYEGKPLPPKLKAALDANDAALEGQRGVVVTQEAEMARINRLYDDELVRLRKLWAGAPPGSLGPSGPGGPTGAAAAPGTVAPKPR